MIQAKVTTAFKGRPDEETKVREIAAGEVITGDLARVAVREKWAEEISETAAHVEEDIDLDSMKVDELRAYAADRGIDLGDATKKADLIAAVKLASS